MKNSLFIFCLILFCDSTLFIINIQSLNIKICSFFKDVWKNYLFRFKNISLALSRNRNYKFLFNFYKVENIICRLIFFGTCLTESTKVLSDEMKSSATLAIVCFTLQNFVPYLKPVSKRALLFQTRI